MKRSRFTEDQIMGILKEHEAGVSVADLCRKHGVSDATVYRAARFITMFYFSGPVRRVDARMMRSRALWRRWHCRFQSLFLCRDDPVMKSYSCPRTFRPSITASYPPITKVNHSHRAFQQPQSTVSPTNKGNPGRRGHDQRHRCCPHAASVARPDPARAGDGQRHRRRRLRHPQVP